MSIEQRPTESAAERRQLRRDLAVILGMPALLGAMLGVVALPNAGGAFVGAFLLTFAGAFAVRLAEPILLILSVPSMIGAIWRWFRSVPTPREVEERTARRVALAFVPVWSLMAAVAGALVGLLDGGLGALASAGLFGASGATYAFVMRRRMLDAGPLDGPI